jgi:dsRNA-specific ribonuclease
VALAVVSQLAAPKQNKKLPKTKTQMQIQTQTQALIMWSIENIIKMMKAKEQVHSDCS